MNKKSLLALLALSMIAVACGILGGDKKENNEPLLLEEAAQNMRANVNDDHVVDDLEEEHEQPDEYVTDPNTIPDEASTDNSNSDADLESEWTKTTKQLDARVREMAAKFGVDPKDYRLFVREEPRGGKIYRMLGMYVIVNPNGEEVYLPDHL